MAMSVVYTTVNGQVLSENRGGVVHHFIPDPLGSVVMVQDAAGNTVYTAEYAPYGDVQSETGTNPSEFGYVGTLGYVKDSASSLYVRARYLLTNLGRWLTKDPLWPSKPGYVYARARPVVIVDRSGLGEDWIPPAPGGYYMDCYPGNPYRCTPRPIPPLPKPTPTPIGDLVPHGNYCGQSTDPFKDPCKRTQPLPTPMDCLDNACKEHDACLNGLEVDGPSGAHCHCLLAVAANYCNALGCAGDLVCQMKSRLYVAVFSGKCLWFPFEPGPPGPPISPGPGPSPEPWIIPHPIGPLPGEIVRPGPNPIFN